MNESDHYDIRMEATELLRFYGEALFIDALIRSTSEYQTSLRGACPTTFQLFELIEKRLIETVTKSDNGKATIIPDATADPAPEGHRPAGAALTPPAALPPIVDITDRIKNKGPILNNETNAALEAACPRCGASSPKVFPIKVIIDEPDTKSTRMACQPCRDTFIFSVDRRTGKSTAFIG